MGIKTNEDEDNKDLANFIDAMIELSETTEERLQNLLLFNETIFSLSDLGRRRKAVLKNLHDFADKVIQDRKQKFKIESQLHSCDEDDIGAKKRVVFIDLLLKENEKDVIFSDRDIRDEVNTFILAGHHTTSMSIGWALYFLGRHPALQEEAINEQKSLFGHATHTIPTSKQLTEMKYLERVIKETMRIYPPVPAISRRLSEDVEIDGHVIPKDTTVSINIFHIHRDEKYYPEPEKFDPDRFLPEPCQKRHAMAYIPFSAGPRVCLGPKFALMQQKMMLSMILRNFRVEAVDPIESMKLIGELIVRPARGIRLRLLEQ